MGVETEKKIAMDQRQFLIVVRVGAAALGATNWAAPFAKAADTVTLPFGAGERVLVRYPQKRPLIQMTARPPQLETPFSVFNEGVITPNDAFFVRYHLADIPLRMDPEKFRVEVKGRVTSALSLSLQDLKTTFEPIEIVAVNQCSGNSRGFFEPRVAGGQLANGAMGNARWRGVPLKAVLDKAGVMPGAKQVTFNGLDGPAVPETPDFVKALDIDHAARRRGNDRLRDERRADLPHLNGYPLRLVVPGYYGTYWVKHLNEITVVDAIYDGFWMKSAYRIPNNTCACTSRARPRCRPCRSSVSTCARSSRICKMARRSRRTPTRPSKASRSMADTA